MTDAIIEPTSPSGALVSHLYRLAADPMAGRKALMSMRSSLGHRDGIAPAAVAHVGRFAEPPTSISGPRYRQQVACERNLYLVAGLFSLWHVKQKPVEDKDEGGSLGKSMKSLAGRDKTAAETLMADLTSFPQNQIGNVMLRAVTHLAKHNIRLDWHRLARDLTVTRPANWRVVQRRWAADYYSIPKK